MSICICDAYAPDKRPGLCPIHSDQRSGTETLAATVNLSEGSNSMASHTVIISLAIVVHDADERRSHEDTGALVEEILHAVIRDRTSLDLIQSIVQETRESTEFEVHTTNTNDISDPPHLPAYESEDGLTLVTLVNNEQEALVAHRYARAARWDSPTHTYITRD